MSGKSENSHSKIEKSYISPFRIALAIVLMKPNPLLKSWSTMVMNETRGIGLTGYKHATQNFQDN